MLKSVEGIYRNAKIELTDLPEDVRNDTRVIVTFLETAHIDLRKRGIDETQAAELRARLETFAEEWDSEEMSLYDNYDAALGERVGTLEPKKKHAARRDKPS